MLALSDEEFMQKDRIANVSSWYGETPDVLSVQALQRILSGAPGNVQCTGDTLRGTHPDACACIGLGEHVDVDQNAGVCQ